MARAAVGRRASGGGLAPLEQRIHQARRAMRRIPSKAQHDDADGRAAEAERLVAAPHVEVQVPALHFGAGVHHRVDTVVTGAGRIDLHYRADREQIRIGSRDP